MFAALLKSNFDLISYNKSSKNVSTVEELFNKMSIKASFNKWMVFAWFFLGLEVLLAEVTLATSPAPTTTHIVNYLQQRRAATDIQELQEFDFEHIKTSNGSHEIERQRSTPLQQLYGRFVQHLDANLNTNKNASTTQTHAKLQVATKKTDDLLSDGKNTLDSVNDIFKNNTHHESVAMKEANKNVTSALDEVEWHRMKQSIPVLEPVKHFVNSVRDGAFNLTAHMAKQHHQLVGAIMGANMTVGGVGRGNESSAIETEEEREMVNVSEQFKILDFFGSIFGMIWGFIANIQKLFAASSGNASAASSATSS